MRKFILAAAALGLASLAYADTETDVAEVASQDAEVTAEAEVEQPNCLKYTGSRIRKADGCLAVSGRVYSRDNLVQTGQADTGEALSHLDPAIQVRGR